MAIAVLDIVRIPNHAFLKPAIFIDTSLFENYRRNNKNNCAGSTSVPATVLVVASPGMINPSVVRSQDIMESRKPITKRIQAGQEKDPEAELLMSIPGISYLTVRLSGESGDIKHREMGVQKWIKKVDNKGERGQLEITS